MIKRPRKLFFGSVVVVQSNKARDNRLRDRAAHEQNTTVLPSTTQYYQVKQVK
jgi:hypothetical protein